MHKPTIRFLAGIFAISLALPASRALAQRTGGAFVTTLGADTIAVEQYVRSGDTVTGDVVNRQGGTAVDHYVIVLNADGSPASATYTIRRPTSNASSAGPVTATLTFSAESLVNVMASGAMSARRAYAVDPSAGRFFPTAPGAMVEYELLFQHLRATRQDSLPIRFVAPTSSQFGLASWIKVVDPRTARIWIRFGPPYNAGPFAEVLRFDDRGHLIEFDGRTTTSKNFARRVPSVDIATLAAQFAAADVAGKGLRNASASDSVRSVVGAAHIAINYSRPEVRGRDVFKNGVLGDTIWRTGANFATSFTTDRDLAFGGAVVPAGSYTLWTHVPPDNSSYELIINKLTKEWGTDYHPDQDLVRIPLRVTSLATPVEAFLISVEPQGSGGVIKLQWARTQLEASFAVR